MKVDIAEIEAKFGIKPEALEFSKEEGKVYLVMVDPRRIPSSVIKTIGEWFIDHGVNALVVAEGEGICMFEMTKESE